MILLCHDICLLANVVYFVGKMYAMLVNDGTLTYGVVLYMFLNRRMVTTPQEPYLQTQGC